jgi:hypothetical protein
MKGKNSQDELGSTPHKEWNDYVRLQVFTAVLTKIQLFENITRYRLVNTDVSVEISAAIFRILEMHILLAGFLNPKGADRKQLQIFNDNTSFNHARYSVVCCHVYVNAFFRPEITTKCAGTLFYLTSHITPTSTITRNGRQCSVYRYLNCLERCSKRAGSKCCS